MDQHIHELKNKVRAIVDYPEPGIVFRDITTLMGCKESFRHVIDLFTAAYSGRGISKVAGIEARGFIFGAALAHQLGAGFVPIRKAGKLPHHTYAQSYSLEYGEDTLEIHKDSVEVGERVLLIDDLLATGGTAIAALDLIEKAQAITEAIAFVIDLPALGGKKRLLDRGVEVLTLIEFEGH